MWYVIQVMEGNTDSALSKCRNAFPQTAYREMFVPMYECMHKKAGQWYVVRKELFSGYFFVDTENGEMLLDYIKRLGRFVKPVFVGDEFVPITEIEQQMLESLLDQDKVIAMSKGNIRDGEFDIYEGPLIGKGNAIRKIDRHKRLGYIELSIHGKVRDVYVGLEIVNKTKTD